MAKKIEETDKNFNLAVVEIGKWAPVNFKLLSKMKKYDDAKKMQIMQQEMLNLNEIVGRYKKNIESKKEILEKRKIEKIKQGAAELNGENDILDEENTVG